MSHPTQNQFMKDLRVEKLPNGLRIAFTSTFFYPSPGFTIVVALGAMLPMFLLFSHSPPTFGVSVLFVLLGFVIISLIKEKNVFELSNAAPSDEPFRDLKLGSKLLYRRTVLSTKTREFPCDDIERLKVSQRYDGNCQIDAIYHNQQNQMITDKIIDLEVAQQIVRWLEEEMSRQKK